MNPADDHRDPDVDAAWRAANREQPPPALDATIAAAARRAVGAGPKSPQAPHAWWPVAAAAVVAIVAIGIVEMTPPDEIVPQEISPAAPASPKLREQTQPPNAGASAQQASAPPAEDERKTSPAAAGALAARREAAPSNGEPALAKSVRDSAAVTEDAQPRTVDEWIRLIRRLKTEGRNDLAAKELAAFRTRYQERADALLPADLREMKP